MTTKIDISRWFDEGVSQKATHMIVVCDTFDHEDYPVFIKDGRPRDYKPGSMQRIMEVYKLEPDIKEQQMSVTRSFNWD